MITQAELKQQLLYDPGTGVFTRRVSNNNNVRIGSITGSTTNCGYLSIMVCGDSYQAHRLAWLYEHGYFPEHQIDHMNGVRDDNRISNLRHVTRSCNQQNQKVYTTNKSGFPGVYWESSARKWNAQITVDRRQVRIGRYPTALEAALARYTCEVWHPNWICNHRSKLAQAIKKAWPEFNPTP